MMRSATGNRVIRIMSRQLEAVERQVRVWKKEYIR